ncbi:hypothetical protein FRC20_011973 [Serendipita sp. 405]|nr:hypothetical protein FRC20_011973 [Serendipita sp. 405]
MWTKQTPGLVPNTPFFLISFLSLALFTFKTHPAHNNTKATHYSRHHQEPRQPATMPIRKSESDEEFYRGPMGSPTTHCFLVATRPKRTRSRWPLTMDLVEATANANRLNSTSAFKVTEIPANYHKRTITPPRSTTAFDLRQLNLGDREVIVPYLGTRPIYCPQPPSLLDIGRSPQRCVNSSSSTISIRQQLTRFKFLVRSQSSLSPDSIPTSATKRQTPRSSTCVSLSHAHVGTGRYSTDEEMHICTTSGEDDDDDDEESLFRQKIPSAKELLLSMQGHHAFPNPSKKAFEIHPPIDNVTRKVSTRSQGRTTALPRPYNRVTGPSSFIAGRASEAKKLVRRPIKYMRGNPA